jgi:MarR family 2-MHQ and catechol resistance regulon transcriptional repressor
MRYSFQQSLGRLTQQVSRGLGQVLEMKFKKAGYEINSAQWTVISYLNYNNFSTQKKISQFLGVNKVMTKRIIDKLEDEQYVKRTPSDRDKRFNRIELTKKGQNLYHELTPFAEETLDEAYRDLDSDEIKNCLTTLKKITQTLDSIKTKDDE